MKRYLIAVCLLIAFVGCDCDCGEIAVKDHYETRRGMQLYFVIETPCGDVRKDVDMMEFAAYNIGDRYCNN